MGRRLRVINDCTKCGGEGWLWWNELEHANRADVATGADRARHGYGHDETRYTCDLCHGEADPKYTMRAFDPAI